MLQALDKTTGYPAKVAGDFNCDLQSKTIKLYNKVRPLMQNIRDESEEVGSNYKRYFVNCIFNLKFHVSLDGNNRQLVNDGGEKG